jgi:hypothetical protein
MKPYSVLLLYPDYLNDSGTETYYAHVEAADEVAAVARAQALAYEAARDDVTGEPYCEDREDFVPLLVTHGHHASLPLWDR